MSEKPITLNKLALLNIKQHPVRNCCLILVILFFSATLYGGTILIKTFSLGTQGMADKLGADILIVPEGYKNNIELALLRGEPSSFYLNSELVSKLNHISGIAAITPQLFIASLDAGCCTAKVQLIGYDPETDFVISPWLDEQLSTPIVDKQIIIGSKINAKIGDEIRFYDQPFQVVAKMDATGMGFDTSVFMTLATAQQLLFDTSIVQSDTNHVNRKISSILIKSERGVDPKTIVNEIMPKYAADYAIDFVLAQNMITQLNKQLSDYSIFVLVLSVLLWLLSMIIIFIVFFASLQERKAELTTLRILGASRVSLVKMLLCESLLISVVGALLGIILAAILLFSFRFYICQSMTLPCGNLSFITSISYAILVFILTVIIGPFASLYSTLSATKFDAFKTMKG